MARPSDEDIAKLVIFAIGDFEPTKHGEGPVGLITAIVQKLIPAFEHWENETRSEKSCQACDMRGMN